MSRYSGTVLNEFEPDIGQPIAGASVYVYESTPAGRPLAELFDDDDQPLDNPLTTDDYGGFYYNADDGLYDHEFWYAGRKRWVENRAQVGVGPDLPADIVAALAVPGGAALVGSNDGASGSLWTTVAGFIAYLRSSVGSSLINFIEAGTGAVSIALQTLFRSEWINVKSFGAVGDGVTDDAAAIQAAVNAAYAQGRILLFPAGNYLVGTAIQILASTDLNYTVSLRPGFRLIGSGSSRTVFNSNIAGPAFTLGTNVSSEFALGNTFQGFTIRSDTRPAGCSGIRLESAFNVHLEDIHIIGLRGYGVRVVCADGDHDASNMVSADRVRIDSCDGWGLDCATDSPHNENSFLTLKNTIVQGCGTANDKIITGITQANPAVVTSNGHGLTNGTTIVIYDVAGMVRLNARRFVVAGVTTNTFQLSGEDSTSYTAYSSGGVAANYSGGIVWKGQILTIDASGIVLSKNVGLLIPGENGLANGVDIRTMALENNHGRHCAVSGCELFRFRTGHQYSGAGVVARYGFYFNASAFPVTGIDIDGVILRTTADNNPFTAFHYEGPSTNSPLGPRAPRNVKAQNFFYPDQTMFYGFFFDPIPDQGRLSTTTTVASYAADFWTGGRTVPFRQAYGGDSGAFGNSGPWVPVPLNASVTLSNSGIGNNQIGNVYHYDSGNAHALEYSAENPLADTASGLQVKTGEPRKRFIGRVATDGSGNFLTTASGDANWLNPVFRAGGWYWTNTDGKAMVKAADGSYASLPTSDTDGTIIGTQS